MGKKWVEVKASWKPGSLEAVGEHAKIFSLSDFAVELKGCYVIAL